ncbi:uncharacterized protein si:dkey-7l6.3 isoform X2 [Syngnathus scovelli]|uniref:uncharacterized protein si:dkey-7l6.3 isoform X2 n=1 Tax=Syngnathus scovelli TaxID=161590 RepID=UPI002110BAF9|nr:transcriptional repressor scratch 2 isoform X2 [Syngnathus scovelli]
MATMKSLAVLHSQLASIMEALTRAAVTEMCQLVDDSYAVVQMELTRSREENDELRRKLKLMETIIARGCYGGEDAATDSGAGSPVGGNDKPDEVRFPSSGLADRSPNGCNGLRGRPAPLTSAPSVEDTPSAAEDTSRAGILRSIEDVSPVKQEVASDEDDDSELLLLDDDGAELVPEAGPSGMVASNSSADSSPWEQNNCAAPRGSLSFPGSAGLARDISSNLVRDGQIPPVRENSAYVSQGPDRVVASCGPGGGAGELDLGSSWTDRSLASIMTLHHRPASDLNTAFPLALGLAVSRLDATDRSRLCGDRRFVCHYCGKWFSSARSLETHVRVHTGERPYCCGQCGKRFTQSGHLKTHQSVHTGERPFGCHCCAKRFAGKQNLRIHLQKHHPGEQQEG